MSERIPFRVLPMLANLVPKPFHRPGWVYEEKYDGYRILAYKEGAKVTLRSRNDHDRTATFAGVARAVGQLQDRSVLLDGEVVAFDSKGLSRFQLMLARRLAKKWPFRLSHCQAQRARGVVGKDCDSPYVEGRSRRWLKVKVHQEEEFVIGGFTAPRGSRSPRARVPRFARRFYGA